MEGEGAGNFWPAFHGDSQHELLPAQCQLKPEGTRYSPQKLAGVQLKEACPTPSMGMSKLAEARITLQSSQRRSGATSGCLDEWQQRVLGVKEVPYPAVEVQNGRLVIPGDVQTPRTHNQYQCQHGMRACHDRDVEGAGHGERGIDGAAIGCQQHADSYKGKHIGGKDQQTICRQYNMGKATSEGSFLLHQAHGARVQDIRGSYGNGRDGVAGAYLQATDSSRLAASQRSRCQTSCLPPRRADPW